MKILYTVALMCLCIHSYSLASDGVSFSSSDAASSSDGGPLLETKHPQGKLIPLPQVITVLNNTNDSIRTSPAYTLGHHASRLLKKNRQRKIPTVKFGSTGPMLLQGLGIFIPAAQGYYILNSNLEFLQNYSGLAVSTGAKPQDTIFHAKNIDTGLYITLPDKFILIKPTTRH